MHMIVEHPTTQVPTKEMSKDARFDLLQSSVTLIDKTLGISKSERLRDWTWYFRGYMQWYVDLSREDPCNDLGKPLVIANELCELLKHC